MFRDKHRVKKIEFEIKQGIGESTKYEATANLCENENGNTNFKRYGHGDRAEWRDAASKRAHK